MAADNKTSLAPFGGGGFTSTRTAPPVVVLSPPPSQVPAVRKGPNVAAIKEESEATGLRKGLAKGRRFANEVMEKAQADEGTRQTIDEVSTYVHALVFAGVDEATDPMELGKEGGGASALPDLTIGKSLVVAAVERVGAIFIPDEYAAVKVGVKAGGKFGLGLGIYTVTRQVIQAGREELGS